MAARGPVLAPVLTLFPEAMLKKMVESLSIAGSSVRDSPTSIYIVLSWWLSYARSTLLAVM